MIKKHIAQFDKHAHDYTHLNIIQKEIARELAGKFELKNKKIIDIGCGNGEIFSHCRESARFVGIDSSIKMLSLHDKNDKTELIHADFDSDILDRFCENEFDIAISSSALQWSKDIKTTLGKIQKISKHQAVGIFCSGTFETIRRIAGIDSFLPRSSEAEAILRHLGFDEININSYKLYFQNNLEAFRYIKKSGVSSGNKVLNFRQTKELIEKYPLDYLEFEAVVASS